jgi:hypothetical protein
MKINWKPKKTFEEIGKNPGKAIAGQAIGAAMGPIGQAVMGARTVGGKKEKEKIDSATGGLSAKAAQAADEVGGFIQDPLEQIAPKTYNPGQVTLDRRPFHERETMQTMADQYSDSRAARMGQAGPSFNTAPQEEFRGQQMDLASQLAAQAQGEGPSLATLQMQQNTDDAIKSAMALAASGRGGSAGGRLKSAMDQASMIQQQGARDSAALRAQEQIAARDQLNNLLTSGRGQDINIGANQLQADTTSQGQKDAMSKFYDELGYTVQRDSIGDAQKFAQLELERILEIERLRQAGIDSENAARAGLISGLGQAGATLATGRR